MKTNSDNARRAIVFPLCKTHSLSGTYLSFFNIKPKYFPNFYFRIDFFAPVP